MSSTRSSVFALVDGNNFYVSCERLFNPRLEGRPVVVLSNNDGCIVSRSAEVKALGVPMGAPIFKMKEFVRRHRIITMSSNYALYGDLSQRMMSVVGRFSPAQEIYSIDESFLDLTGMADRDLAAYGQEIRHRVRSWVGIPTCVGIAGTKTLAKLANHAAKKRPHFDGVCDLGAMPEDELRTLLQGFAATDVWGVGRRMGARLELLGIKTAEHLREADGQHIRARFGVVMERTVRELRGVPCQELEEVVPNKQQIISSRSFGRASDDVEELTEAVTQYMSTAAEKMRRQSSVCAAIQVFLQTNPFKPETPQYHPAAVVRFSAPTDDSVRLVHAAVITARRLYRPGYMYKKAGVMLLDLQPRTVEQLSLFDFEAKAPSAGISARQRLMATVDVLNRKDGRGTVRFASEGVEKRWTMRRENVSSAFTTNWDELPIARA